MHLDLTHADGLILLTAVRSRDLYLRQVLADPTVQPDLVPDITREVTRLTGLMQAIVDGLTPGASR
jgi:hypothetical protein